MRADPRTIASLGIVVLVGVLLCSGPGAADAKQFTKGVYLDSGGDAHDWYISDAQALVWDGTPYIPAGAAFAPSYFLSQTDASWQADVGALQALKGKGITDLLIRPAAPASSVPSDAWQKLIDYLDQEGFRYGIDLADGPRGRATGFVVCPRKYKYPKVNQSGVLELSLPALRAGSS